MQLQFKSLRSGTVYTLSIGTASGTLTGAAEPFVTQEADDADMFLPIRTQTGYIRIVGVNDRATWLSLIPNGVTSIRVKLTHGNNVIDWQGFMTPGVFSNEWPGCGAQEHEFPVQCPLSVLDGINITRIDQGVVTFGWLLNYIFNQLSGITINHYYVQGTPEVTKARLDLKVIWANFLETDNSGTITAKYTCYQVLEEVCKFFGYTCRMIGDSVYFTQPTGNNIGFTDYTLLTGTGTYIGIGIHPVNNNMLASNDMQEQVVPGVGKVTVSSDINKLGNLIEIPYDELFDRYYMGQSSIIVRSVDYYERGIYCAVKAPDANGTRMTYEDDNVSLECYMATVPGTTQNAGNQKKYCRFLVYDDNEVGDVGGTPPESKKSYSWKKCVELFHSYNYSGSDNTPMFKIASKQSFIVSDGILYVSFKCDEVSAWLGPIKCVAKMKLGDKYWDGANQVWTTTEKTFDMYFTSDGALSTRTSINDPEYDGCGIPITNTMRGMLEFTIEDMPDWEYIIGPVHYEINGFLPLMDFKIGFVRGTIEEKKHSGNEYIKTGGSFRDQVNVDLIFAADVAYGPSGYQRHMPAGLGYILNNSTEKPQATIKSMSGEDVIPEEYLAIIIADFGRFTHIITDIDLLSNMESFDPKYIGSGLCNGMYPMAISHKWRDDITHITFITLR